MLAEAVSSLGLVFPDRACNVDDLRICHRFGKSPIEHPGAVQEFIEAIAVMGLGPELTE